MAPEASQSSQAAPVESSEVKQPEKAQQKEPEKQPEKIEETPLPPAKEEVDEKTTTQPAAVPEPQSKPSDPSPAASQPVSKPAEPSQSGEAARPAAQNDVEKLKEETPTIVTTPADAPTQNASGTNAFSAMMDGKSPRDPQPEASKPESSEKPSEAPQEDSQKPEDTTPAVPHNTQVEPPKQESSVSELPKQEATKPADDQPKADSSSTLPHREEKTEAPPATNGAATNGHTIEPKAREDDVPASILEKGIIYFFFRPRVNIDSPQDVTDIARSYLVLRPLPHGAALNDGAIPEGNNSRLIALPKKVLPLSGKDRFMVFVEKAKSSFSQLKDEFMSASDYATQTQGTSHSPPVTPVAEGVYAITTTGRESHLAYMTTIPSTIGEVQKDIGLRSSGSFVVSAKNPKAPGPANASLDTPAEFPEDIIEEFSGRRWMPLQPKLLDYHHTQFLLIGESGGVEPALEGLPRDEKQGVDTPMQELEKLEGEDEIRVKHLKGMCTPAHCRLW